MGLGESLFVCLVSLRSCQQLGYIVDRSQDWRMTILRAATQETEQGDHDFCFSRSYYTDNNPTSREWAKKGEELLKLYPAVTLVNYKKQTKLRLADQIQLFEMTSE